MSNIPPITSSAAASPMPAGFAIGQISTHFPHRVHASSISAVRTANACSNAVSTMGQSNPASRQFNAIHPKQEGRQMAAFCSHQNMDVRLSASK
jgi:hypothetical protein